MNPIKENLNRVLAKIEKAAIKSGRDPAEIQLVAVSKTIAPELINQGIAAGIKIIGENKVQEARAKKELVNPVIWHMVGHLQTNKVKHAVQIFDKIQAVDSYRLAEEINKRCELKQKSMPVLVEINTSGEMSKFGCDPDEAAELVSKISELVHLRIEGLMTIGLFTDQMELVRPCFVKLRGIFEKIKSMHLNGVSMVHLSMGMSADYEVAIEEGATMVRIGTAIFGARQYQN
ncbi:MAG: YggS family pyridoxal phosphate-dependent enzyme [Calditrichia bacterium]|nr:YggS family pyridoxal phosphate-dependent enzyme [Calditrichia bacterium]